MYYFIFKFDIFLQDVIKDSEMNKSNIFLIFLEAFFCISGVCHQAFDLSKPVSFMVKSLKVILESSVLSLEVSMGKLW